MQKGFVAQTYRQGLIPQYNSQMNKPLGIDLCNRTDIVQKYIFKNYRTPNEISP